MGCLFLVSAIGWAVAADLRSRMIGLAELQFLRSPQGEEALEVVKELPAGMELHRAIDHLRKRFAIPLASSALELQELRRRARGKFSRAEQMLFTGEGLEQSSGEILAVYRASRFAGRGPVTDLCCGIGGDALGLAAVTEVEAVDQDLAKLVCLEHNLDVYGRSEICQMALADAREYALETAMVFVDPSRRQEGRRVRPGEDYSPPLSFVLEIARKVEGLAVKVAPSLDLPPLPEGWEVELVSLDRVCREMVLWSSMLSTCKRKATVLRRRETEAFEFETFTLASTASSDPPIPLLERMPLPGEFLLEPDPAVIRAHLVAVLAGQFEAHAMDPQVAYLVSPTACDTPFAALYRVLDAFPFSEKRLKQWLTVRGVGDLTVKKRGFPLSPEELRRRLHLKGPGAATVVLTRTGNKHLAVLVEHLVEQAA